MLDFKVDLSAVRAAKERKAEMLTRLKQIDFENTGFITLETLGSIGERYGVKLGPEDLQALKDKYKKGAPNQAPKVDYVKTLNDLKLKIDFDGGIGWAFGKTGDPMASPYRVKIQRVINDSPVALPVKKVWKPIHKRNHSISKTQTPIPELSSKDDEDLDFILMRTTNQLYTHTNSTLREHTLPTVTRRDS